MTHLKTTGALGAAMLMLALALPLPAIAIDTGGEDASPAPATTVPTKPKAPAITLATARADIDASQWAQAITDLKAYLKANPKSADGWNLLGYSYRNHGDLKLADTAYDRALKLNPSHTGALSYQGLLYIKLGEVDEAKANLAKIEKLCGNTTCPEYVALSKALG